ncbi:hypothetical protein PDESU_01352 [Pontiella desulfatans]|uniref:Uncharacterized protein n=1 Tax=Pontiella desulfatans TaxID=2750659 RepID=A0A6C2TYI7_PONDE|nr:hypothetical protein [Pontiella desulfatans]VGO12798.1 hypothetical protein PDESU_01352 [Pontiella desulfatans]
MSTFKLSLIAMLTAAAASQADVSVMFTNNLAKAANPFAENTPGTVTLDFAVDGGGNVTLDASCSESNATIVAEIDKFDGPVGTVSYSGAFGTSFSIALVAQGGTLRLSEDDLGGFGVTGQNQWRIDRTETEQVKVTPSGLDGASIDFKAVDWTSRANGSVQMKAIGPQGAYTNALPQSDGTWDLDAENIILNNGKDIAFMNATTNNGDGYVLAGISFDVVQEIPDPGVKVVFTNSLPNDPATVTNMPISITLDFDVDAVGFVTLDASCEETNAALVAIVDAWDGPAGYVDYTNNVSFSVKLESISGDLRLSGWGGTGGLGLTGQNQWRVDQPSESLALTLDSLPGVALKMKNFELTSTQSPAYLKLDASSGSFTNAITSSGTLVIEQSVLANNDDAMVVGVAVTNQGYVLSGFEFVLVDAYEPPPEPGVGILFSYDDSTKLDFGNAGTITLDFAIDGSGVVSLDASTTDSGANETNAVNGWDSADVGFVTNAALFGKSFTLTGAASVTTTNVTTDGIITLWNNNGGILAIQGQNSGRIDGYTLNVRTNMEAMAWTLSGDVSLDFESFSYGNSLNNAGIELSDADTALLYTATAQFGDQNVAADGFSIGSGQALTFTAVTNYTWGIALGGFSFQIVPAKALSYTDWAALYPSMTGGMLDDDDNDGLDNLYEFAVGGNPVNGTVAPAYMPVSSLIDAGGSSNVIEYVYTRRHPVPVDMGYTLNVSDAGLTLPNWADDGYTVIDEGEGAPGFKTVTNHVPVDANTKKFIKLVVEQN